MNGVTPVYNMDYIMQEAKKAYGVEIVFITLEQLKQINYETIGENNDTEAIYWERTIRLQNIT